MNTKFKKEKKASAKFVGHVKIVDKATGEVVLDKYNAIHPQNMARVIAKGLSNESNHQIYYFALGNGGTYTDASGNIVYLSPNTTETSATLYNETYAEIVDDANAGVGSGNSVVSSSAVAPDISSLVVCTITLAANEPSASSTNSSGASFGAQASTDGTTTNSNAPYMFDELGLKTSDGLLLTHLIFSPIEKNAQREFVLTYTITIAVTSS